MDLRITGKPTGRILGAIAFGGLVASGCGSDDNGVGADPDAAGGNGSDLDAAITADACAPGHGEQCEGVNMFEYPEGAKFRMEIIETGPDGVGDNATEASFWHNQTPPSRGFLGTGEAFAGYNDGENEAVGCYDLRGSAQIEGGATEANQEVYDTRTFLDVGPSVTFTPVDGGDVRTLLPEEDGVSRAQGLQAGRIYLDDQAAIDFDSIETNAFYTADFEGTAEFPVFTPSNGFQITADAPWDDDFLLFLPGRFDLQSPAEADYFADGIDFGDRSSSVTFEVDLGTEPAPDGVFPLLFAVIQDVDGGREFVCIQSNPAATTLTIPEEVVAETQDDGLIQLGRLTHFGWIHDERQVHNIGVTCKASHYCTEDSIADACND